MNKYRILSLVMAVAMAGAIALGTGESGLSADHGWSASFEATGWIDSIESAQADGLSPTSSAVFVTDGDVISNVQVSAVDQTISGGISELRFCQPSCSDPSTVALTNAELIAVQSYEFDLVVNSAETIEYTMPGGSVHEAEALFGTFTGAIGGSFTVGDGPGKTAGELSLELTGTGGFVCFAPTPGPLDPCMAGEGRMLPVDIDFTANGQYAIDITSSMNLGDGDTVYEIGDFSVDMNLIVDLGLLAADHPEAISAGGFIDVEDVVISYE